MRTPGHECYYLWLGLVALEARCEAEEKDFGEQFDRIELLAMFSALKEIGAFNLRRLVLLLCTAVAVGGGFPIK